MGTRKRQRRSMRIGRMIWIELHGSLREEKRREEAYQALALEDVGGGFCTDYERHGRHIGNRVLISTRQKHGISEPQPHGRSTMNFA